MNCLDCGSQLKTKPRLINPRSFTGYCSTCVRKHTKKEVAKHESKCLTCGNQFLAKRKIKRYCSQRCVEIKNNKSYKNPPPDDIHPLLKTLGNKPRLGEVRNCAFCEKEIYVLPVHSRKTKTSFCCKEHLFEHLRKIQSNFFFVDCEVCKAKIRVTPSQQKHRPRKTCSKDCLFKYKRLQAEKRRADFGYTKHQLDRLARYSPEAADWRKKVFERDNYTCQLCFARGGRLEADHIKPWAFYENLRFELSNGRTLCRPCHDKTKMSANTMRRLYEEGYWDNLTVDKTAKLKPDLVQ